MPTKMLRRARELWNTGNARVDRHNQQAWIRSIRFLGERWLLARKVGRIG